MTSLDWIIVTVPFLMVLGIAAYARRYNRSVADFMAAGRCAGRYLLANARGEAGSAVAVAIAIFEIKSRAGFTLDWWNAISVPVGLLVSITGFVVYRYRETRAMTLAQFFEIRYSRNFRLFMGILAFLAGILNYGIFPAIGGRFVVYFLGLPETLLVAGHTLPVYLLVAAGYLSCTLFYVLMGGQVSVLIGDCLEGIIAQIMSIILTVTVFVLFNWNEIQSVLAAAPAGQSMLNPFDTRAAVDFNMWFVVIQIFSGIYGTMAWQNSHAFNASALTPHDARMAGILGNWRSFTRNVMLTVLTVGALTFLSHPKFAVDAMEVRQIIGEIGSAQIQTQMTIPVALSHLLPVGIKGVFCAVMLLGLITGDSAHLHSWGSIFVQDVILPLRKKPLPARLHMWLLRGAVTGVAIFAFCFSAVFQQTQYVQMWWIITTAVFLSGAGSAIIGGLYWNKGTTAGAWSAVIVGSVLALGGIAIQQSWPGFLQPRFLEMFPGNAFLLEHATRFPVNSQYMNLGCILSAIISYVAVSRMTCRETFNMDRMLHRGAYSDSSESMPPAVPFWMRFRLHNLLGFDSNFTRGDKVVAVGIFSWSLFWSMVVIVGSVWNLIRPWPETWWGHYWFWVGIVLPFIMGVVTTVWFTIGGFRDMALFFRRMSAEKRDDRDDGTVVGHRNLDEVDGRAVH